MEKWWQDVLRKMDQAATSEKEEQGYIINVICPHSGSLLSKHPFDQHKHQLCHNHSITVDAIRSYATDRTRNKVL